MDENFQNMIPNLMENQNCGEGTINNDGFPQDAQRMQTDILKTKQVRENQNPIEEINTDSLPEDAKLVQYELLKMKQARQKSFENTANLQRKVEEELKAVQEKQAAKIKLEKEIVELQGKLNDEKYNNDTLRTGIGKIREMSKEIGKFCVRNERTIQQCSQQKTSIIQKHEKIKTKLSDNITKLEEIKTKTESEVALIKQTIMSQREIHRDSLEKKETECLEMKEKVETFKTELENTKQKSNELLQIHKTSLNNIAETEADNKKLEEIWHHKQKCSGDLLTQMEEDLQTFEQRKEEISNLLDEARYTLQKKETEMEGIQRGIKNQTEYNKNFREKLAAKIKEISDIRLQNEQLEAVQKEKHIELASNEESLTAILNIKLEEEKNAKALLSDERTILNKTEEQIKDAKQIKEELLRHIEAQESIVSELKTKQNNQLEAITAFEQELYSLKFKQRNLKEEFSKWQMKFATYECNILQVIASKTAAANTVAVETEEIKTKEQETATEIQEMESIKMNFDIVTAQETSDFEEKRKELQQQIEMIEKELSNTRTLQVQLDEELQQLNINCDNISQKIKDQENANHAFSTIPVASEPSVVTLLPPVRAPTRTGASRIPSSSPFSVPSSSGLILPPPGPTRHRDFDELSGSSAEGNMATSEQILEYKRQKQRRHMLREQQRMMKSKKSSSQSKPPGK